MIRIIISLCIAALLGLLPGNLVVKESWAHGGFGDTVNQYCPSQPFTGDNCELCHLPDRSAPTPEKEAYSRGDYCYFCPNDPCTVGGSCAGTAQASVIGPSQEHGSSILLGDLAYFLLALGAVIGMMIWRRKR